MCPVPAVQYQVFFIISFVGCYHSCGSNSSNAAPANGHSRQPLPSGFRSPCTNLERLSLLLSINHDIIKTATSELGYFSQAAPAIWPRWEHCTGVACHLLRQFQRNLAIHAPTPQPLHWLGMYDCPKSKVLVKHHQGKGDGITSSACGIGTCIGHTDTQNGRYGQSNFHKLAQIMDLNNFHVYNAGHCSTEVNQYRPEGGEKALGVDGTLSSRNTMSLQTGGRGTAKVRTLCVCLILELNLYPAPTYNRNTGNPQQAPGKEVNRFLPQAYDNEIDMNAPSATQGDGSNSPIAKGGRC